MGRREEFQCFFILSFYRNGAINGLVNACLFPCEGRWMCEESPKFQGETEQDRLVPPQPDTWGTSLSRGVNGSECYRPFIYSPSVWRLSLINYSLVIAAVN